VTKADLPWRLAAFGYAPDGDALALRAALRPMLGSFPFASVTLIGRERPGVLFRRRGDALRRAALIARVDAAFGLDHERGGTIRRCDARYRPPRAGGGKRLAAVRLAGDTDGRIVAARLAPRRAGRPPRCARGADAGRTATERLRGSRPRRLHVLRHRGGAAAIEPRGRGRTAEAALSGVQDSLKCGTQCGSCLPD
jgi:assimilatory nitrate reductase catalytic subunit